jgi:hypothetical protein
MPRETIEIAVYKAAPAEAASRLCLLSLTQSHVTKNSASGSKYLCIAPRLCIEPN